MGSDGYSNKPMVSPPTGTGDQPIALPNTTGGPVISPIKEGPTFVPFNPAGVVPQFSEEQIRQLGRMVELAEEGMALDRERTEVDARREKENVELRNKNLFLHLVTNHWAAALERLGSTLHDPDALMEEALAGGEKMYLKMRERVNTLSEAGIFADKI